MRLPANSNGKPILLFVTLILSVASSSARPVGALQDRPVGSLQDRIEALGQVIEIRLHLDETRKQEALERISQVITSWNGLDEPTDRQRTMLDRWISQAMSALMNSRVDWMPDPIHFVPEPKPVPKQEAIGFTEESLSDYMKRKRNSALKRIVAKSADQSMTEKAADSSASKSNERRVAKPTINHSTLVTEANQSSTKKAVSKKTNRKKSSRSKWSKHPASAPLDWSDPFKDDPKPTKDLALPVEHEVLRPTIESSNFSSGKTDVVVNQAELSSIISDYNLAIRSVRMRLAKQNQMASSDLLRVAEELSRLDGELNFIHLYFDGLSEIDQMMLPEIESPELANQIVARRVEEQLASSKPEGPEHAALRAIHEKLAQTK